MYCTCVVGIVAVEFSICLMFTLVKKVVVSAAVVDQLQAVTVAQTS